MNRTESGPDVGPLLDALDAEYAAVFAYGVVGAHVAPEQSAYAAAALTSHRTGRDWLRERITRAGGTPPPAAAAYEIPDTTDPASAARLAASVELAVVPRWSAATAVVAKSDRPFCTSSAQAAAVRALTWGAQEQPFPGTQPAPEPSP